MLLTKISGLRDPQDIELIGAMGPTYMTFDFISLSQRYMGEVDASIFHKIPFKVRKTGRFADEHTLRIIALAGRYNLTAVQLDGKETAAQCEQLSAEGLEVLKTVHDFNDLERYEGVCNRLIVSAKNLKKIPFYKGSTPIIIETQECKDIESGIFCGVDCGEGYETTLGCKNLHQIQQFIDHYRAL